MEYIQADDLLIKSAGEIGRGVFAGRNFKAGEVLERAPAIVVSALDRKALDKTVLFDYYFKWGVDGEGAAIVLGYGSIYNHSFAPNAGYQCVLNQEVYEFVALQDIRAGEEIRINYNGDPTDKSEVWFDVIE